MASPSLTLNQLFDADFLNGLQHFCLSMNNVEKGGRLAEQKSSARGQGLEFADYKPYLPGDDLRTVDWGIYQRLKKLFVRTFVENQDMPIYFLIDTSASMFHEETPRIHCALRATLALAAVALGQHDSIGLFPFSEDIQIKLKSLSGKRKIMALAQHLAEIPAGQKTHIVNSIQHFSAIKQRRGLAVIISDFFDSADLSEIFNAASHLNHQLLILQLSRATDAQPELDLQMQGDLKIEDCETRSVIEISFTPALLESYKKIYQAHCEQLKQLAAQYNAGFAQLDTEKPVLPQLHKLFANGILK